MNLSKIHTVITLSLTVITCAAVSSDSRPNILVLISDDQNMDSIGAYGSRYATPSIDRLAAEGILHTRAYTTATLCVPTRYSCLTGSYPSRSTNSIFGPLSRQPSIRNGAAFRPDEVTMVQALREAGYFTGATGKWHNDLDLKDLWKKIPKDADPRDPQVIEDLKAIQDELRVRLDRYGFDYAEYITEGNLDHFPSALEHHNIEYTVHGALSFLDQVPEDQPFFLWTAFTTTHGPHEPIDSGDLRHTPEGYTEAHLGVMPERSHYIEAGAKWRNQVKEMVLWMDGGIGVILERLEATGQLDNTLVIFLSDQQNAGKASPYERGANIPFIARWPGHIKPNTKSSTLIDVTDMAATFMDVADAEPLEGMQLDGLSIVPVWGGETDTLKPAILTESGFAKGVITENYKYIAIRYNHEALARGFVAPQSGSIKEHLNGGSFEMLWEKNPFGQPRDHIGGMVDPDQLFDLRRDPQETKNLAGNPEYAKQLGQMQSYLKGFVQAIGRPFGEFSAVEE
ncbi:MAG: sulfatase-like hydrolase/transferase [Coraliomargarita sp.]|nr:sulfatase-like hydrolase/transferase [Coraliomargarita sp.]